MKRFLYVTFGSILFASGFTLFIEPLNVAPGGLAGIVVILTKLYPFINTGAFFLLLNIPLLLIGAITFGIKFFFGTVYATLVSSIMMSFFSYLFPNILYKNELLFCLIGSVIMGIGLALVFRGDVTTGGTDIIARLIHKRFAKISLGLIFFILDTAIILLSGLIFGEIKTFLLSTFSAAIMSFVFNYILHYIFHFDFTINKSN